MQERDLKEGRGRQRQPDAILQLGDSDYDNLDEMRRYKNRQQV